MATLIYVDKENGEPGIHVPHKEGLKLGSVSCKYTGGYQITEKTVKAKSSVPASDDSYPEIEKFFPFDPLVPLMILDEERELEQLLHVGPPSPLKMPPPLWES
ncbi:PTTG1, partial [Cervus elaphus hippelaphus]